MRNIIFFIFITIFTIMSNVSSAYSYENVKDFIRGVGDSTLGIVSSQELTIEQKEVQLEELFKKVVDTGWIARFVLGRYWNNATDEQQKRYTGLYHKFLFNNYLPNFKEYTGQNFKLQNFIAIDENEYLVQTEIEKPGAPSVRVDYRVRKKDDTYVIFDIIAEGISLITTQRSEFSSILSRKGLEVLIEKLEAKLVVKS